MSRFVVSAAGSGHGKTLVALALAKALRDAGARIQPYKIGPDYIDASFYARVAGRPAYNVDLWLDGEDGARAHVEATRGDADALLFEGMMGLFDGADDGSGTTADVARLVGARVVLVLDCWAASQTAAAVAFGLRAFDPRLDVAGVVLNRVGGVEHERAVREACARAGIAVLAAIPFAPEYRAEERRLGLDAAAVERRARAIDDLAVRLADSGLVRSILDAPGESRAVESAGPAKPADPVRIAYARDDAFWFTYPETLVALRAAGAEPVPFSPLRDAALPEGTRGVWLGGGYPESFAAELEANAPMRAAIARAAESGMPIYGECGGFMYLAETLETENGTFAMAGVLRGATSIAEPKLRIGYREACACADSPLDPNGATFRAYEFHYASAQLAEPTAAYAHGNAVRDGAVRGNVVASFLHRHILPGSASLARFVAACAAEVPS
jgi:cobyrinic acid a,c-diamide synthase